MSAAAAPLPPGSGRAQCGDDMPGTATLPDPLAFPPPTFRKQGASGNGLFIRSGDNTTTTQDAHDQIRRLRDQVEQLMREHVTPIISDAAGRAQDMARTAQETVSDQAEAVSSRVP